MQNDDSHLELIVDGYNINYEHNNELMHKCQELSHYSYLIHRIRYHKANGKSFDDAILIAIKDCIKHKIMLDYLLKHQSEVSEIMKLTWTHKGEIEYECEKAVRDGLKIIVLYNDTQVNRTLCPEAVKYTGIHAKMQVWENGTLYWDYRSVKAAFDQVSIR